MKQIKSLKRICVFVLIGAIAALSLAACERGEKQPVQSRQETKKTDPCALDTERLCKGVKPGEGRIIACLKKQQVQLSQACRESINKKALPKKGPNKKAGAVKAKQDPCKGDINRLCKGVKPGEGRFMACLKNKINQLSPNCKSIISKQMAPTKKKAAVDPCKGDAAKFCKGVKPGEGRIIACLAQKPEQLSDSCKKMVMRNPPKAAAAVKDPCAADLDKFCKGIDEKESALGCLRQHQMECSAECRKLLEGV